MEVNYLRRGSVVVGVEDERRMWLKLNY